MRLRSRPAVGNAERPMARGDASSSTNSDDSRVQLKSSHGVRRPPREASSYAAILLIATFAFAVCAGAYIIFNAPTKVPLAAALPFKASEAALNPLILDTAAVAASTASSTDIAADSSGSMLSATTSASLSPSSSGVANAAPANSSVKQLEALGISTFLGNNTGAIASWYRTENPGDYTNGRSWCQFPYNNSVPGFAPSLKTMLASFDQNATAAKIAFCGLEARVYSPVTRNMTTLYLADAFDDTWVLTPASIDVIKGSFPSLFGNTTDDKKDVVQDVWWFLTGARNETYAYKGEGVS